MLSEEQVDRLMALAVRTAREGIAQGESPFGCVIASRSGACVAAAHNTVASACDASAHAEINAIRAAGNALGTPTLSGHVALSTCEPCPMCAAALVYTEIDAIYFGASLDDAAAAGMTELLVPMCRTLSVARHRPYVRGGIRAAACRELFAITSTDA